jgi:hypothetical protein
MLARAELGASRNSIDCASSQNGTIDLEITVPPSKMDRETYGIQTTDLRVLSRIRYSGYEILQPLQMNFVRR